MKEVELTLDFLLEPKVGDLIEVEKTPIILSVMHRGVVLHAESRVPEGTKVYATGANEMETKMGLQQLQEGTFVGCTRSTWEDDRGDVHEGVHRFLVEVELESGNKTLEFPLLDVDRYWSLQGPQTSIDYILKDWDAEL
jgi:hypothetical protein